MNIYSCAEKIFNRYSSIFVYHYKPSELVIVLCIIICFYNITVKRIKHFAGNKQRPEPNAPGAAITNRLSSRIYLSCFDISAVALRFSYLPFDLSIGRRSNCYKYVLYSVLLELDRRHSHVVFIRISTAYCFIMLPERALSSDSSSSNSTFLPLRFSYPHWILIVLSHSVHRDLLGYR